MLLLALMHYTHRRFTYLLLACSCVKATKVEDLQKSDYDEEIKRRSKRIFIPNWFTIDLKTGVSRSRSLRISHIIIVAGVIFLLTGRMIGCCWRRQKWKLTSCRVLFPNVSHALTLHLKASTMQWGWTEPRPGRCPEIPEMSWNWSSVLKFVHVSWNFHAFSQFF